MNRVGFLGGTDAMRIMNDDWHDLYLEKTGQKKPDDLSGIFKVQLGTYTEDLHRSWFEKQTGLTVLQTNTKQSKDHPFMWANLDGWIKDQGECFLEMKHSSNGVSVDAKARYYMAQLQHYMYVVEAKQCYFSVIKGNDEPEHVIVDRNDDYIELLVETEKAFWYHVENEIPPEILPKGKTAAAKRLVNDIPVDGMRIADMSKNNQWADLSVTIIQTAEQAKLYDDSKKQIRDMVDDDVIEAFGHGINIKRDKRGRLTVRLEKQDG